MNEDSRTNVTDDIDLAALLATAGPRELPSAAAMAAVRAAVEAEWQKTVNARRHRRQFTGWAMAAGVSLAAIAVWIARPLQAPGDEVVAELTRVVGSVELSDGKGPWQPLAAGESLSAGVRLRTGTGARVALRLDDGLELRLDDHTLLALDERGHATLTQGAMYLDSGTSGTHDSDFTLATPAGTVRHLGTQYEARLVDGGLQVAIREGRVQVDAAGAGSVVGAAGEQLLIGRGRIERSAVAANAAQWDWLGTITPPFRLEGRRVEEFLAWAGRESGRTIEFASPDAEQQAGSITLSGTLDGLTPDEAVTAVLSTTSLQAVIEPDRIRIEATGR